MAIPEAIYSAPAIPGLWQVSVTVPQAMADMVSDWLELSALAVSIDIGDGDDVVVSGTFDSEPDEAEVLSRVEIFRTLGAPDVSYVIDLLDGNDWLAMVGRTEGAGHVGEFRLGNAPSLATRLVSSREIYVEAFSAFGDGYHATTQGCLSAIGRVKGRRRAISRIADIGCGTGVLALAARKTWPRAQSVASDLDPAAVELTRKNRHHNGALRALQVTSGAGFGARLIGARGPYDLILMNILARPLARLASDAAAHLRPGGYLVLSGLLESQARHVMFAYRAQRLALIRQTGQDGWQTLILQKKA